MIRISPVRVITAAGEQLGVLPIEEALRKDQLERQICIAVCRTRSMSLAEGQAIFTSGRWREMIR